MENIVYQSKKLRKERRKVAVFDVDWTLICPKGGRKFPKDATDWQWLHDSVPLVVRRYYRKDFRIVFLTDQTKSWKVEMIKAVIAEIGVPVTAVIAMNKEDHKPSTGLFLTAMKGVTWKSPDSFYVGDAAGRPGDWADKDKVVADKLGLRFYTPEEMFFTEKKEEVKGPSLARKGREVVIMVGFPGSGKSTIAKELETHGYIRMDGDLLKTGKKMVKEAEKTGLASSIVFDATNGTKERRAEYIAFAKKHGLPVRCIWKTTSIEDSMRQNRERAGQGGPKVPDIAFYLYRKKFEEPGADECEVTRVA